MEKMKKTIVRLSVFCMIGTFLSAAESGSQKDQSWFAWACSFFYPSTVSKEVSSTSPSQNCMNVSEQSQAQVEETRQLLEAYCANHIVTNENIRILKLTVANATTAEELEQLFEVIFKDGNKPSLHVEFSENFGGRLSNGQPQDRFRDSLDKKYQELRLPGHMAYVLNRLGVYMRDSWTNVTDLEKWYTRYLQSDEAKTLTQRQLSELQSAYEHRRATVIDPKAAQKEDEAIDKARENYQAQQLLRLQKLIEEREKEAERYAKSS
jgi:hypothetical protein